MVNKIQFLSFSLVLAIYIALFWLVFVRRRLTGQLLLTTDYKRYRGLSLIYWSSPFLFLAIWGLVSSSGGLRNIPTPIEVLKSFVTLTSTGQLINEARVSVERVAIGFILASVIGVPVGLLAGTFVIANRLVTPVNSFLRYIPPTSFIALLIVYFGVDEAYKYAVIFFGLIFFIIQMVVDVVDDLDKRYIEIGITSGFSNWDLFTSVVVPSCWPRVWDVLRINLSAAWTFLVAAEIVGAESGLGHLIAVSQRFLRISDLYAGILAFGIIGLVSDKSLEVVSKWLFKWYYIELRR